MSDFWFVLKDWVGVLAEILGSFYADHVRFDLRHPCYISDIAMVHLKLVNLFVEKQVMLPAALPDIESENLFCRYIYLLPK